MILMACILGCVAFVEAAFFFYLRRRSQQLLLIRALYKQQLADVCASLTAELSQPCAGDSATALRAASRIEAALSTISVEERRERSRRLADVLLSGKSELNSIPTTLGNIRLLADHLKKRPVSSSL